MIRAYRYGLRAPTVGADLVREQISLAHRYYNRLIEIERARRAQVTALREAREGELTEDARAARTAAVEEVKVARREALKRRRAGEAVDIPPWPASLVTSADLDEIDAVAHGAIRAARATCGCFWGTYLLVEASVRQAAGRTEDPRFRRWDGTGRIGVQLQGGLSAAQVMGGDDTRLRIDPLPAGYDAWPRARRQRRGWTFVHIRVGSDGRAPVWATFPALLHRRPPADGVIKWATVVVSQIGPDTRYHLSLAVDVPDAAPTTRTDVVAVDLGWRRRQEGLRVGYWCDGRGQHGELVMPSACEEKLEHARSIKAIKDRAFNSYRERLATWAATLSTEDRTRFDLTHIGLWRSAGRVARLAGVLRVANVDPPPGLDEYLKQDRHLWRWTQHETRRALNRRKDIYRERAADLVRRYGVIVIERFNLAKIIQERPAKDADVSDRRIADAASSNRHAVAAGEFRTTLRHTAQREGVEIVEVDARMTTRACHVCGYCEPWDQAREVVHECARCKTPFDQDYNAAVNLLARCASGDVVEKEPGVARGRKYAIRRRKVASPHAST